MARILVPTEAWDRLFDEVLARSKPLANDLLNDTQRIAKAPSEDATGVVASRSAEDGRLGVVIEHGGLFTRPWRALGGAVVSANGKTFKPLCGAVYNRDQPGSREAALEEVVKALEADLGLRKRRKS